MFPMQILDDADMVAKASMRSRTSYLWREMQQVSVLDIAQIREASSSQLLARDRGEGGEEANYLLRPLSCRRREGEGTGDFGRTSSNRGEAEGRRRTRDFGRTSPIRGGEEEGRRTRDIGRTSSSREEGEAPT